jgi:hypothetical protein
MYIGLHVRYPLFLSDFIDTCILSAYFQEILKYEISRQSVFWEQSCSMRTNGLICGLHRNVGARARRLFNDILSG